ncbi:hypothetical protein K2Y11_24330 [bacterium]|nr:hypothetical protein [bacterium]
MSIRMTLFALSATLMVMGCDLNKQVEPKKVDAGPQRTQDIGEYKPAAATPSTPSPAAPSQPTVTPSPFDLPTPAIGKTTDFVIETTAKLQIEQATEQYKALNGNYPKSHEEFMEEVIKKGDIHLNAPPAGKKYQYDVENHELKVVDG